MSGQNWAFASLLAAIALFAIAYQCVPQTRTVNEAPTPTPTIRVVTVTPAVTSATLSVPTATVTAIPAVIDLLPMQSSTPLPATSTPLPATTPTTVPTPDKPPVQRG